jgi:hypothetical protein
VKECCSGRSDGPLRGFNEQKRPLVQGLCQLVAETGIDGHQHWHEAAATRLVRSAAGNGGSLGTAASIGDNPTRRPLSDIVQHIQEREKGRGIASRACNGLVRISGQIVETDARTGDEVAGAGLVVREVAVVK